MSSARRNSNCQDTIVVAMRYFSSQGVIHCDLNRDTIMLDCDWTGRIADFELSISLIRGDSPLTNRNWTLMESHDRAPEG
jgi:serine/threonine protein kinase